VTHCGDRTNLYIFLFLVATIGPKADSHAEKTPTLLCSPLFPLVEVTSTYKDIFFFLFHWSNPSSAETFPFVLSLDTTLATPPGSLAARTRGFVWVFPLHCILLLLRPGQRRVGLPSLQPNPPPPGLSKDRIMTIGVPLSLRTGARPSPVLR